MIALHLHGPLAKMFGKLWELEVATIGEAVNAIDRMRGGFRDAIMDLDQRGLVFRVRTSKGEDLDNTTVEFPLAGVTRVDIIPIVAGASAGVRFVVGAVLAVVGFGTSWFSGPVGAAVGMAGVSLMTGSVIEWLTPLPKKRDETTLTSQSWSITGPTNTADQGLPVPLAYGEVLAGAYTVSAGISVSSLSVAGSVAPSARIGGATQVYYADKAGVPRTVVLRLGAGSLAIAEPFTYSWSMGTFSGASHTRELTSPGAGVCLLEVTLTPVANTTSTVTGTINLNVAGKEVNPANGAAPANVNANASVSVSISLYGVP